MRSEPDAPQRLTCTCSREPLLARVGIENGRPFLQIRAMKAGKALVDLTITEGIVKIKCRECLRVHTVKVAAVLREPSSMMALR